MIQEEQKVVPSDLRKKDPAVMSLDPATQRETEHRHRDPSHKPLQKQANSTSRERLGELISKIPSANLLHC